jgi:hypothetical protein
MLGPKAADKIKGREEGTNAPPFQRDFRLAFCCLYAPAIFTSQRMFDMVHILRGFARSYCEDGV